MKSKAHLSIRRTQLVLGLLVLGFGVTAGSWAQTTHGTISGVVAVDGTGTPVSGAEILLLGNGETFYVFTNDEGLYTAEVPEGHYVVGVRLFTQDQDGVHTYTEYFDDRASGR